MWCCDSSHEDRYETLISQIHQLDLDSTVVVLLSVMCLFDSEQVEDLSAKSTIISHGRKFSLLLQRWYQIFWLFKFKLTKTYQICNYNNSFTGTWLKALEKKRPPNALSSTAKTFWDGWNLDQQKTNMLKYLYVKVQSLTWANVVIDVVGNVSVMKYVFKILIKCQLVNQKYIF